MPRFPAELFTYLADPIDHVAEEKAAAANEELQPSRLRAHVDAQQPHMILLRLTHIYWTPPKPNAALFSCFSLLKIWLQKSDEDFHRITTLTLQKPCHSGR